MALLDEISGVHVTFVFTSIGGCCCVEDGCIRHMALLDKLSVIKKKENQTEMEELFKNIYQILTPWISLFLGAAIANWFFLRREKASITFDLHREFNSNEFSKYRRLADELLEKVPSTSYDKLSEVAREDSIALFTIMRFINGFG